MEFDFKIIRGIDYIIHLNTELKKLLSSRCLTQWLKHHLGYPLFKSEHLVLRPNPTSSSSSWVVPEEAGNGSVGWIPAPQGRNKSWPSSAPWLLQVFEK